MALCIGNSTMDQQVIRVAIGAQRRVECIDRIGERSRATGEPTLVFAEQLEEGHPRRKGLVGSNPGDLLVLIEQAQLIERTLQRPPARS